MSIPTVPVTVTIQDQSGAIVPNHSCTLESIAAMN